MYKLFMLDNHAIEVYENYLLGKTKVLSLKELIKKDKIDDIVEDEQEKINQRIEEANSVIQEKKAIAIIAYAITKVLRWTPVYAADNLTSDIVDQLKIRGLFKYIDTPMTIVATGDYKWIIKKVFPLEVPYNMCDQAVDIYKKILNGQMKSFPHEYFKDEHGEEKLAAILKYYIATNFAISSVEDLYIAFGRDKNRVSKLDKACLYYAYSGIYESPLELLHYSIGKDKDDFLYEFYSYMNVFDEVAKNF